MPKNGALERAFVVPPFSVFDARQGYWQARKRRWLDLGLRSDAGRDTRSLPHAGVVATLGLPTQSVFDPVLCEVLVRWLCPLGGRILDPFAGGSVRGVVASRLGRAYEGVDLRPEQVDANEAQRWLATGPPPRWIVGDSAVVLPTLTPGYDFILTCPPYGDLEVYSQDARDLSAMRPEAFDEAYRGIMARAAGLLAPDRFAAVVVGNYRRGPQGLLADLRRLTADAMAEVGCELYNAGILLTVCGSAAMRAHLSFRRRKFPQVHQEVLVFLKGDAGRAAAALGLPMEGPDPFGGEGLLA